MDDDESVSGLLKEVTAFLNQANLRKKSHSSSSTFLFPKLSPQLCRNRQEPNSCLPHFLWNTCVCPWRQLLRNNTFTFLNSLKTFPGAEVLKCLWSKLISPNPVDQYTLWVILFLLGITIWTLHYSPLFQMTQVSNLFWQVTHRKVTLFLCFSHRKNQPLTLPDLLLSMYDKTSQFSCIKKIYPIVYVKGTAQCLLFSKWHELYSNIRAEFCTSSQSVVCPTPLN